MPRGVYYLGPLRDYPKREYTWAGVGPADMERRGEYAIAATLAAGKGGKKLSRGKGNPKYSLEEYVAHWLKELKLIDDFRVAEIKEGTNLYRVYTLRVARDSWDAGAWSMLAVLRVLLDDIDAATEAAFNAEGAGLDEHAAEGLLDLVSGAE